MRCIARQKHRVDLLLTTSDTIPICQKGNSDIDSIILIIIKHPNAEYIILPDFKSLVMH
jgi:hypothetical protein